jgi:flagellar hook-basal body complex protein FliE
MVAPLIAAKAYAAAQGIVGSELAGAAGHAAGPDFGQMVTQAINQVATDSRAAETQITAQVQGKASLIDVVTALSSAQTSLNTMVAVRNQMIQSYQQIMNMAI